MTWQEWMEKAKKSASDAQAILKEYDGKELPEEKSAEVDSYFSDYDKYKKRADQEKSIEDARKFHEEPEYKRALTDDDGVVQGGSEIKGRFALLDAKGNVIDMGGDSGLMLEKKADGQFAVVHVDPAERKASGAFMQYLRKGREFMGPEERKALNTISDPEGGYITRHEFRNQFITRLRNRVKIRQMATEISTNAASVSYPTFDYDGDIPKVLESRAFTEEDLTDLFGRTHMIPSKRGLIFRVPMELLEDSEFGIIDFLTNHFSMRFGEIEEYYFLNGTGLNEPLGLLVANLPDQNADNGGFDITAEDVIDLAYGVREVHRGRSSGYLMHRNVVKAVRKLRSGDLTPSDDSPAYTVGSFLWQPSFQAGEPATINGFPVIESEWMPDPERAAAGAGDTLMIFADMSQYWIVDKRNSMVIQRLEEKYAEYDQVGVKFRRRFDASPVTRDGFRRLARHTS